MSANAMYYEQLDRLAYPKTFASWLEQSSVAAFFEEYCENVVEDEDYIVSQFQSVFDVQTMTYTVGELIEASPLTMQNQLNPSRIAAIWKDSATGLNTTGQLLQMPRVIVKPDGQGIMLFGGNHRLASLVLPFVAQGRYEGEDFDALMSSNIKVLQYSIDFDAVSDLMAVIEEDNTEVRPTQQEMVEFANKMIVTLWQSDNESRTMKASEISGAKLFEKGIDRNDNEQLLDALYNSGKAKLISQNDAAVWITKNLLETNLDVDNVTDEDGHTVHNPDTISKLVSIPCLGTQAEIKVTSFSAIIKAFMTALNKDTVSTVTSSGKEKKIKVWSKDLKDSESFLRIFEAITEGQNPLLYQAIDNVIDNTPEDSEYRTNLTKQATAIGQELYSLLNIEPEYDVLEEKPKATTTKVRKHKLTTGLGL